MDWIYNLLPTLIGLIGAAIGWYLKSKFEDWSRQQDKLRIERAEIYIEILMPFIRIFSDLSDERQEEALKEVKSVEYRKIAFKLALLGDDEVVRAWNDIWQQFYLIGSDTSPSSEELILSLGDVLLAIRRGHGINNTKLDNIDMLSWMFKDVDSLRKYK